MSRPRIASRTARLPLLALIVLLAGGWIGSLVMAGRARADTQAAMVTQARAAVDHTLSSIFSDSDLSSMSSPGRAAALNSELTVALGATAISDVTLYNSSGTILYDMASSRIGNKMPGQRGAIKTAARGGAVPNIVGSDLTVLLSIQRFGTQGTVMLTMPKVPIDAAGRPWTAGGLIPAIAIFPALLMLWWVGRLANSAGANVSFRPQQGSAPLPYARVMPDPLRPRALPHAAVVAPAQHGLKVEADARRLAEDRAKAAEERLSVLQEQYRNTLDELHTLRERTPATDVGDPALEERALHAEGQLRLLEGQLSTVTEERDQLEALARQRASAPSGESDPQDAAERARMETELAGARAQLEGTQTQLVAARREVETLAAVAAAEEARTDHIRELEEDLDAAHVQILTTQEALEAARAELDGAGTAASALQLDLAALRTDRDQAVRDRDTTMLESREETERLQRELETTKALVGEESEAVRAQVEAAREATLRAEQASSLAVSQADATRKELRALRNEEQRAAMLEDELRAKTAELANLQASHLAELVERDADLEERVRRAREDFQAEFSATNERFEAANADLDSLREELSLAVAEVAAATERADGQAALTAGLEDRTERAERELHTQQLTSRKVAAELQEAIEANADLARKLQDVENRRQLELADEQGQLEMDQILYATQERLAGQTERLIETEERARVAERSVEVLGERLDEALSQLRSIQMSDALRDLREEGRSDAPDQDAAADTDEVVRLEDRRASSPFLKELTMDAKKSLTQILGIAQILKYKKEAKDQAQLVKQLTAYARRLNLTVSDLADADKLARGTVELTLRRTDLEALVQRVAAESDIGADHDLRITTESVICGVDQLRTEQALAGLLRTSGDRTPTGKTIIVTLQHVEGGALISVADPEPSSDGSVSPVVRRFAEIQGGWATVESREDANGSVFRVFLPDGGPESVGGALARPDDTGEGGSDVQIVVGAAIGAAVEGEGPWDEDDSDLLVREIGRIAEPS